MERLSGGRNAARYHLLEPPLWEIGKVQQEMMIFYRRMLICKVKFIILNTKFIILNTKFIIFLTDRL